MRVKRRKWRIYEAGDDDLTTRNLFLTPTEMGFRGVSYNNETEQSLHWEVEEGQD